LSVFIGKVFYFDLEIESDRNLRQVYEWVVIANVVWRSVSKYKRLLASDNLFFCNSRLWRLEKKLIALGSCLAVLVIASRAESTAWQSTRDDNLPTDGRVVLKDSLP
jgi:hypothetical protein